MAETQQPNRASHLKPGSGRNPTRNVVLPDTDVLPFLALPESSRNLTSKLRWAELDYRLTGKVLHLLKTPGRKDHLALKADITSAAIARDKAYLNLQEGPRLHLPTPILQKICEVLQIQINVLQPQPIPATGPVVRVQTVQAEQGETDATADSAERKVECYENVTSDCIHGDTRIDRDTVPNSDSSITEQTVHNQPDTLQVDMEPDAS